MSKLMTARYVFYCVPFKRFKGGTSFRFKKRVQFDSRNSHSGFAKKSPDNFTPEFSFSNNYVNIFKSIIKECSR